MRVCFKTLTLSIAVKLFPVALLLSCGWGQKSLLDEAKRALSKAVRFFRTEVAVNGSYVWTYSEELKKRWGESEATEIEGWVQPPGTPSVGMAFLRAYEATGDKTYLDAAVETAHALTATQLASGGWDY